MHVSVPEESVDILYRIASALEKDGPIAVGTMFRSPGLRTGTTIVAFLGSGNDLLVKLPRERGAELVDGGDAERVTMGSRSMREWVSLPAESDPVATEEKWTGLAREAFTYVRQLHASDPNLS